MIVSWEGSYTQVWFFFYGYILKLGGGLFLSM